MHRGQQYIDQRGVVAYDAGMAKIDIASTKTTLTEPGKIRDFLADFGVSYEQWPLEDRVSPDAEPQVILDAYKPELDVLKSQGGYVTADVINVNPATPNLDAMLNRFNKEHTHSEDEVRFILKGRGVFHFHPDQGPVFALEVEPGDLINVPAGTKHWFDLCTERTIRAIRLFKDTSGWTPAYVDGSQLHLQNQPLCWGPAYVPTERAGKVTSVI